LTTTVIPELLRMILWLSLAILDLPFRFKTWVHLHFNPRAAGVAGIIMALVNVVNALASSATNRAFWHSIIRRREDDAFIDISSLCWMLQNAPREELLRRVARQITNIEPSESHLRSIVNRSNGRLHQAFWDLLGKVMRASSGKPEVANDMVELMDIAIYGRAIVYTDDSTKTQWSLQDIYNVLHRSFELHDGRIKSAFKWTG